MEKELLKKKKYINIFHNLTTAWLILIASLMLTAGAYFLSASFVQQRVEDRFSFRAIEIESAIKDRLGIYEQVLWGGVGLWNSSKSVTRQEWANYMESLKINQHWPGIQGIGFSIPVQLQEKQSHIEKIRSEGFPEYLIRPEGTRDLYSAIIYLEPFDWRNQRAFGYDMWSNEMRRKAMTRARDEGVAATSGIITLVQETKEDIQRGFLMYLPVYQTKTIPITLKEKRERFIGWVYAPFRAGDLMKGIVGPEDPSIEFKIFDGETLSQEALLFDSNSGHHLNQPHHFQKTVRITLQGRLWTIQFNPLDTSSENSEKHLPLLVALAGGFVDILLFYVIFSLYFINRRAETIAEEMTQESRNTNEKLIVINTDLKKTTVSRNYMDSILQSMTDTLIVISYDETIQSMNQATLNLLGYEEPELIGKSIRVVITEEEKELGLFSGTGLKKLIEKGTVHGVEMTYTAKKGRKIPMLFSGSVMKDKEGTFLGIACVALDITERKQTEEKLKKSENRFRSMFENHSAVMLLVEPDSGKILDSNKAATNFYGYTRKEITSMNISDINTLESEEVKKKRKLAEATEVNLFYFKHRLKDNTLRDVQVHSTPIEFMNHKILFSIVYDITDRKLAENKIIETKQFYESIIEGVQDGIWVTDENDVIYFANKAMGIIAGIPPVEIQGSNVLKDFSKETTEDLIDFYNQAKKDKKPVWYEIGLKTPSNRNTWQNGWLIPQYKDNAFMGIICTINDITKRKEVEDEKDAYREFLDSVPGYGFAKDINSTYLSATRPFCDLVKIPYDQIKGKTDYDIFPADLAKIYINQDKCVMATGKPLVVEGVTIDANTNQRFVVLIRKHPSFDKNGNVTGIYGMSFDITEIKQAEKEHERLQNQLQQAQKMESVGRLAGGVAHDYNNISSIIIGYSELALDQVEKSDPLYGDLMEILTATKRSSDITQQLLTFARKQTVAPKVLDLNNTIGVMLKMLQRLIGEDIDLAWIPGVEIRPIKIDPSQINQIMANLCVNARDAIANVGRVTVETTNINLDENYCDDYEGSVPGEYIQLSVSDDGCGMTPETRDNIFEPFFTTKGIGKGTGLGLSTVYGIVKQNNGFINVYSETKKGTTFRIYLPIHVGQTVKEHSENTIEIPLSRGEVILLVEDDSSILKLSKRILEDLGYTVLASNSPNEALSVAKEHVGKLNLLITDVVMPAMNGRELSEHLQSLYSNIKTLFMSGYTADIIAHRGVLDEGVCFIPKPFSKKDLALKVRESLDSANI